MSPAAPAATIPVISWTTNPPTPRPVADQIASLTPDQSAAFLALKNFCNSEKNFGFDDSLVLRLIRCSPGDKKFNVASAKKVAVNFAKWSDRIGLKSLTIRQVRAELERGCLAIPGMSNVDGHLTLVCFLLFYKYIYIYIYIQITAFSVVALLLL